MPNPVLHTGGHGLQHALKEDGRQLYLVVYMDQEYDGARKNQTMTVNPRHGKGFGAKLSINLGVKPLVENGFGATVVNERPIYDGPDPSNAKMVARARGHHTQTGMDEHGKWFLSCCIVFLNDSCYPGSTLIVTGMIEQGSCNGEWAIVGGTGTFNLAQGAIYYCVMEDNGSTSVIQELHIGVFYTPMQRSMLRVMFCEFNPSEVDEAIKNGEYLGQGGYGSVYKATIRSKTVAVKINNYRSWQGERESSNKRSRYLSRIKHENLVSLVGTCSKKLTLIYEFLPNGSLEDRLKKSFPWEERVRVATGICSALEVLHNAKPNPVAHGDLKPSNILFDENDVCKLGDFGISRLLKYKSDTATPSIDTKAKGTPYYMDPEFNRSDRLTPQSDVYAVGIIMLQLVTGRGPENIRSRVLEKFSEDSPIETVCEQLVDAKLELDGKSKLDAVKMISLGLRCSGDRRRDRPDLVTAVRPVLESMLLSFQNMFW